MPRRVQDIIPSGRRSIRDIPTHEEEQRAKTSKSPTKEKETEIRIHKPAHDKVVGNLISLEPEKPERRSRPRKKNGAKLLLIFFGSLVVIAVLGYVASQMYAVATFNILPKSYPVNVNRTVVAQSNAPAGGVPYQVISLTETMDVDVPSTDGAYEETRATGKVTIYNEYSGAAQRLIAGTRLSTPAGLIYKLTASVTVPGETAKGPGQITASVVAEKAGQEYNASKSSGEALRLVGFKGTTKYDGYYAKLATDMSGGFSGKKKIVSKEVMASSTKALDAMLRNTLSARARAELSPDQLLFDKGTIYSTSTATIKGKTDAVSSVSITGTMHAIVFDKIALMSRIAGEEIVDSFGDYDFDIVGLDKLNASFTNIKDFSPSKKGSITVNFEGNVTLVAHIPVDEIKSRLIGLPLSDTQYIMKSYAPIIDPTSSGQVMPPWSKVPTNAENVRIIVEPIE